MADAKQDSLAGLNLYQKLAKITGEIGRIDKSGQSSGYGDRYSFIEYAAVAGRLRDLFAKYGVIIIPRMQEAHKQHRVDIMSQKGNKGTAVLIDFYFEVINADKPDERFTVRWVGEAADYGDKATNKAATSALKYYLMRQFNVSEKGEDPDGETPEPPATKAAPKASNTVTKDQLAAMFATLKDKGIEDREQVKSILRNMSGIDSLSTLSRSAADNLIKQLKSDDVTADLLSTFLSGEEAA